MPDNRGVRPGEAVLADRGQGPAALHRHLLPQPPAGPRAGQSAEAGGAPAPEGEGEETAGDGRNSLEK